MHALIKIVSLCHGKVNLKRESVFFFFAGLSNISSKQYSAKIFVSIQKIFKTKNICLYEQIPVSRGQWSTICLKKSVGVGDRIREIKTRVSGKRQTPEVTT